MPYITSADMETWLGTELLRQLSNVDQLAGSIDTDAVTLAIARGEALINGSLTLYSLPLSSPYPVIIVDLSRRLARWMLWNNKAQQAPQEVADDYKDCKELLSLIRKGEFDLGLDTAGDAADTTPSPQGNVTRSGQTRVFTRSKMRGF